jgi:hypothetical protein
MKERKGEGKAGVKQGFKKKKNHNKNQKQQR